jgi:hypothetical protein
LEAAPEIFGTQTNCVPSLHVRPESAARAPGSDAPRSGAVGCRTAVRPLLVVPLLAAACGHPATREECEILARKTAELELKRRNVTDQDTIDKRTKELETARGDELFRTCLGRRITQKAMNCIARADSEKELDACLE